MAYISWSSELEIGVACIDKQHQRIIADINDFHEVSHKTDQSEMLIPVFDEMVAYMAQHFAFEEELLEEAGYAFNKAHERMHSLLLKHLDEYRERFKAGENVLPEILAMLASWWQHHISHDDANYVAAVNKKFSGTNPLAEEWLSATLKMHFAGRDA